MAGDSKCLLLYLLVITLQEDVLKPKAGNILTALLMKYGAGNDVKLRILDI